ncbi:hypothetical protein SCALIN_C10_0112 [Candidatus Scalindua japonica]|uniref:Uncharacterized protein n=2 Tax=Candidatus Scalindua japonica TaxID=1284222 RepID=A0A286TWV2_9BACT|nr:hypothetical protein SCALIN_C10_0112 [Candidatus Scalindua japonica]
MGINLLPIYHVKRQGGDLNQYLHRTFYPAIEAFNVYIIKLKLKPLINRISKTSDYLTTGTYVKAHHNKDRKTQWACFSDFMLPAIKDLYMILFLAAAQIILLFKDFDLFSLSMVLLFIIFLLMQQVQKNYYTPHFNPCWAPVSILAAKTAFDIWPYLLNSGVLGWTVIAFIGIECTRIGITIIKSFSKGEINSFGYLDPLFGKLFRLGETIGQYIRKHSKEEEKLFVWGDQPSIYLYAGREAFNSHISYLVPYAHHDHIIIEDELLNSLREKPPELLLFYNYKVKDNWNIKRLQNKIGIPYNLMKTFRLTDHRYKNAGNPQGICFDFPLYRRNDQLYSEILLDRALNAEINGNVHETRKHLEYILDIFPDNFEASVRLSLMKENSVDKKRMRDFLDEKIKEGNNSRKISSLFRLLAELDVETEDFDNALNKYEKAVASNPNDFRSYNGLGELYLSMDKTEAAITLFNKAVALNPYFPDVYNNVGVLLAGKGKYEDSIKFFQKALSILPTHTDSLENLRAAGSHLEE